jgi:starch phosphorylase
MSEPTRVSHPKEILLSTDVEGFDSLAELALCMRSSWNHATDRGWRQLDPVLWELTHNPWAVLQTVSREKLQRDLADPDFRNSVDDLVEAGGRWGMVRSMMTTPPGTAADAAALYDLLEREVIPEFYARDERGIPGAWVARMRESMARLTPRFSSDRAVREYTEQHYLPAASAYRERAAEKGEIGVQVVNWRHALDQKWNALRFGEVKVETDGAQHVFEVPVYLGDLDPKAVRVELDADGITRSAPIRQEMKRVRQLADGSGGYVYTASVPAARSPADYTARVIPHCEGVSIPLEDARVVWQR